MQTEKVKERFRTQREMLGLPPVEEVLVGSHGNLASAEEVEEEVRLFDEDLEMSRGMEIRGQLQEDGVESGFMQEEQSGRKRRVEL